MGWQSAETGAVVSAVVRDGMSCRLKRKDRPEQQETHKAPHVTRPLRQMRPYSARTQQQQPNPSQRSTGKLAMAMVSQRRAPVRGAPSDVALIADRGSSKHHMGNKQGRDVR